MAILKKNIWFVFALIAITWSVFFLFSAHQSYEKIYQGITQEQQSRTQLSANTLTALFEKYETVIDIVSQELVKSEQAVAQHLAQDQLERLVHAAPSLSSVIMVQPNGQMVAGVARNVELEVETTNILDNPEVVDSFTRTLESEQMVLGRSYFNKQLQTAILPIRKAIRNAQGEVLFVLSLTINVNDGLDIFSKSDGLSSVYDTYLYRDVDRYFQLAPKGLTFGGDPYAYQVPQKDVDVNKAALEQRMGLSLVEIKQKDLLIVSEITVGGSKVLSVGKYLKRHGLWLTTQTPLDKIEKLFIREITLLLAIFSISLAIIYLSFRSVAASERRKQQALLFQANHDYLTKIYNRYYLEDKLADLSNSTDFALLFVDLDNFKTINDSYGHELGDSVLKEVAKRLSQLVDKVDFLVRYSGDEFIFIHYGSDIPQTKELCKRILFTLREPFIVGNYSFILSSSIGVAGYPSDGRSIDELKRYADIAMYESKRSRNTYTFFEGHLRESYNYKTKIEHELKQALARKEFHLVYQPQMNDEQSIHGVEALIRWQSPSLGLVSPEEFIPIAEASGELVSIGAFVIDQALEDLSHIWKQHHFNIELSINVSVKQFQDKNFYAKCITAIEHHSVPKLHLILEVTESIYIDDLESVRDLMSNLQAQGIRISLDDFGTGYSSLSLLKDLPLDELKIDRSFVADMLNDSNAQAMVESVVTIAQKLGLQVVAEGVETHDQYQALERLGCHIYQGYYFSKPLMLSDLSAFIEQLEHK